MPRTDRASLLIRAALADVFAATSTAEALVQWLPPTGKTGRFEWALAAVDDGTDVSIAARDVPTGVSASDHAAGITSSLMNLAAFVESGPARHQWGYVARRDRLRSRSSQLHSN